MVEILTGLQEKTTAAKKTPGTRTTAAAQAAAARSGGGTSFISETAIIQADEETNALIITADPNTLLSLKSVIRQLDIRRAQVHIEAIIAEISTNRDKEVGVGAVVDGTESSESTFPVGISNLVGIGDLIAAAAGSEDAALNVVSNLGSGLTLGVGADPELSAPIDGRPRGPVTALESGPRRSRLSSGPLNPASRATPPRNASTASRHGIRPARCGSVASCLPRMVRSR